MNSSEELQIGSRVTHPDHPEYGFGEVKLIKSSLLDDESTCQVEFEWIPGLTSVAESSLTLALSVESGGRISDEEWGSLTDLRRRLGSALVIAENSRTGTFIRSFTTPLPHQAFLLEKIITHDRFGHLIADDVGMGKTIEAGLIIAAMRQRNSQARILVLAPAGVVLQWQDEMEEHFGLDFIVVGRDFNPKSLPNWKNNSLFLASLDTLKQPNHRDILKNIPPFDLVVCDEGHRLTARREFLSNDLYRTQNYKFVEWLISEHIVQWALHGDGAPRSPHLLLLTATPHQGDDLRFAYLLQLARPDLIEAEAAVEPGGALSQEGIMEACITRTAKKRAVDWSGKSIFRGHESRTMDVDLQDDEKELLNALTRYVLQDMQFANEGNPLVRALAMHTFQKIAASSWAALESAMLNRLNGDAGFGDEFGFEESLGSDFEYTGGENEQAAIRALLERIAGLETNTKWNLFSKLMSGGSGFREVGDKVLIFTQYRRTQEWLAERLEKQGEVVALIHGGLSLDERKQQRALFESTATILISTEAGSEGANLHRKCHLEINYDLPWNPMRLLQRIGRLDRYGQKHRVKVINLRAPSSWDAEISAKIASKLLSVQSSMGQVADENYQTMILGEVHEAINVPGIMQKSKWNIKDKVVDIAVDEAVQDILTRKTALDRLFRDSIGMPDEFGKSTPALGSENFRMAFSWAAAAQNVQLKETRTSDKRFLKGVYHFTLPTAFRGGMRANKEVYLVFDREIFSDVRGEVLGSARGQEIKPSLAGFGDTVTNWFFKTGLHARPARTVFSIQRQPKVPENESWWFTYAARWKQSADWSGPDALFTCATDPTGDVTRLVEPEEIFNALDSAEQATPPNEEFPDTQAAYSMALNSLRSQLPKGTDASHLILCPLAVIFWK